MRRYRIQAVQPVRPFVVRLTFDDGLSGELNLKSFVERGPMFAPLQDEAVFNSVAVGDGGRSFGWFLDRVGEEIDFGADAAHADIETDLVIARAERYRQSRVAAAE